MDGILIFFISIGIFIFGLVSFYLFISKLKSTGEARIIKHSKIKSKPLTTISGLIDKKISEDDKVSKNTDKHIKNIFDSIFAILKQISSYRLKQYQLIEESIEMYETENFNQALKDIPIERINFNHSRINISTLKRVGFDNIYDLYCYNRPFEKITGIGEASSKAINLNLNKIVIDVKQSIYIKLSVDNKTRCANNLVKDISIYLDILPYCQKADELLEKKEEILNLEKLLKKQLHGIEVLLQPKNAFKKAEETYKKIAQFYKEHFSNIYEDLVLPVNKALEQSAEEAWSSFNKDPISFNKIIEDINGEKNPSSEFYGLTDNIAQNVNKTPINLNGMKLSLRKYQEWGTKYMICQKRTILGDEMGLGKTVQAIAAMMSLKNDGDNHFIVICPLSVLTNWCREIAKFSSLRSYRLYGKGLKQLYKTWSNNGGVAVTTYETVKNLEIGDDLKLDFLVVDEAHFIKNKGAQRTQNVLRLVRKAKRVSYLTGTALENRVDEMVELISQLQPSVAETAKQYAQTVSSNIFREKICGVYFRRRRADVLSELPEKTEVDDWCDLNAIEKAKYKQDVLKREFNQARRVSWNVDPSSSTKLARLKEIADLAKEDGRKVLVFSFFLDNISLIKNEFDNRAYGPIYGGVSTQERQTIIDKFSNSPAGSVLVCQINSGGVGLNIQSASVVVICEPQFKPSTENQAISRAYRMGQSRNVLVYHLLAANTVDEHLNELLSSKQAEFNHFADTSLVAEDSFKIDTHMYANIMEKEFNRLSSESENDKQADTDINTINKATEEVTDNKVTDEHVFIKSPKGGESVTNRINRIKQPRGGYLNLDNFTQQSLDIDDCLEPNENVSAGLIGTAVDYLSRYINGTPKDEAFKISLEGSRRVSMEQYSIAEHLLKTINGLDDDSIISAIKLVGYDVAFRAGPIYFKPIEDFNPNNETIKNVREMVKRAQRFFKMFGPVTKDGFTFEGGYTNTISSGDGDFLTQDTLWDFKVSKYPPTNKHTLQILVYYIMGKHSGKEEFKNIKYIGIFNPRLNIVYRCNIEKIPKKTIKELEEYVIGY